MPLLASHVLAVEKSFFQDVFMHFCCFSIRFTSGLPYSTLNHLFCKYLPPRLSFQFEPGAIGLDLAPLAPLEGTAIAEMKVCGRMGGNLDLEARDKFALLKDDRRGERIVYSAMLLELISCNKLSGEG